MRIISQAQMAALFGVSEEAINQWQQQGMPVAQHGGNGVPNEYESAPCIRWLVDREVGKVRGESAKDRLLNLQAEEITMRLAEKRGKLIPAAAIEPALRTAMISAREFLRSQPPRLAVSLVGATRDVIEDQLRDVFDDLLRRLSNWRAIQEADADDQVDGDPADD